MDQAAAQPDLSRDYPEPLAGTLPPLAIDRQRVVHCAAFRRLQHKTQVFVAPESDHFRSRLTHTLEVAHQARCIAALLGLDAELAEVVALAHDLGHPPFGHAGETALNECLREHGGFDHNRHTLRIVEELEHPYPEFRGLNLTRAVRQCLTHHATRYDKPAAVVPPGQPAPPLESQVVDLADRLTCALHDLQDALYAQLITPQQLQHVALWQSACGRSPPDPWRRRLRPIIEHIQRRVLEDIVNTSRSQNVRAVRLSPDMERLIVELEEFLLLRVYRSEPLIHADEHARRILAAMFEAYRSQPQRLPPRFRDRLALEGVYRVVGDYVAGMTDRYCVQELARLSD